MIHEYAIEPSVLLSWATNDRDYYEFFREYGLGTPRIFSSFPKQKAKKLRRYFLAQVSADDQSQQAMRYTEMVVKLVERIVVREVEADQSEWSQRAVAENERIPFNVILSSELIGTDRNLTPDKMYEPGSIWNHQDQLNIHRTTEGFYSAISNLLRLATEQIVVIDPYGYSDKAIKQIQYLINHLPEKRVNHQIPSITLFYKTNTNGLNANEVRERILARVRIDEICTVLKVSELEEVPGSDVFHNRCILTEHGGVSPDFSSNGYLWLKPHKSTKNRFLRQLHVQKKRENTICDARCH
ncbi:hypothetical protein [Desulfogranum marinum]|uniref:hypothetical protein n=1 Tax=Desulfogranum marinum TaxID=453220 RepID=UPI0029C8A555|nr:hypothetical protein [Desulfogranum marinum]